MYSVKLSWPVGFNVYLPSIETWVKANAGAGYVGNSADSSLTLWFSSDPTVVPTQTVTSTVTVTPAVAAVAASVVDLGVTITANTAGAAGNIQLTADGVETIAQIVAAWNGSNPSNQVTASGGNTAQVPAAGVLALTGGANAVAAVTQQVQTVEPTGAPSQAQAIQTYWASLDEQSAPAVAYTSNATAAVYQRQAAAAIAFGQQMMAQFAGQNLQLGITAAGMTKTVRVAMQEVTDCLSTGSLIEAIAEIKAVPQSSYDSTFITPARLLAACNQLEAFCGLTLSTSLT